jgi:pyruvate dehydrogenase E2 component (dihydrolipoamide acetyltransferase)
MQKAVFLPQLELSMENIAVTKWLVQPCERVRADQPILQVETEKAVTDVSCSDSGYLRKQCVKEGQVISGRALLCILTDTPDEPIRDEDTPQTRSFSTADDVAVSEATVPQVQSFPRDAETTTVRAVPAARRLARQLGIDLRNVKGAGPEGRITVDDVKSASTKDRNEAS